MFPVKIYRRMGLVLAVLAVGACSNALLGKNFAQCPGFHSRLVVAADGKTFVTGGEKVILWNTETAQKIRELDFKFRNLENKKSFPPQINALATS
jgi:K+-transporting ATPase c subunit